MSILKMGKYVFYGCGVLGTAAVLVGCVMHNPIPTNIGFVLLIICVILGLFSKER
jgi:hypothetical protein